MQTDGRTSCLFCYTYSLLSLPSYSLMHIFSIKFTFFFLFWPLGHMQYNMGNFTQPQIHTQFDSVFNHVWIRSPWFCPPQKTKQKQLWAFSNFWEFLCLSLRHVDKAFGDQVHRSFIRFEPWEFGLRINALFSLSCSLSYALAASSCCWMLLPVGSSISMGY